MRSVVVLTIRVVNPQPLGLLAVLSSSWFWVCDVQDVLKHGHDSVEVGALPEHLPTAGARVEVPYLGQQTGGHSVQL